MASSLPFKLPEWRQDLAGEDLLMEATLGKEFKDQFSKLDRLKETTPHLLLTYLPLLLAHLAETAATVENVKTFSNACELTKCYFCKDRPTKLRFLVLSQLGKHRELWKLKLVYRSDAYSVNEREVKKLENKFTEASKRQLEEETESSTSFSTVSAEDLLENDDQLRLWVKYVFFHPTRGVERKINMVGIRPVPDSFNELAALALIVERLQARRALACAVAERMVELGLMECASFFPAFPEFGLGQNYYIAGKDPVTASIVRETQKPTASDSGEFGLADNNIEAVKITSTVYVDEFDMQSMNLWRATIWKQPLVENTDFGWVRVIHPFRTISDKQMQDMDAASETATLLEKVDHGGICGSRVYVEKVFTSVAKPGIVALQVAPEQSELAFDSSKSTEKQNEERDALLKSVDPKILVKEGDNLFQDSCVELMFRVFNYIWRVDRTNFPDEDKVPFTYAYDVFPTGPIRGLMEVLTNVSPLNHYDWSEWVKKYGKYPEVRDLMLRSAAGSYVGAYVLGARDRHWDNIMIKDSCMLLQIDFGFVLGSTPPIDAPRFSISPDMEKAFVDVGIWDDFVKLCGKAFISLRQRAPAVAREVYTLFRHTGLSFTQCVTYLGNQGSFNRFAKTDKEAERYVCDQVRSASRDWKTFLRSFAHDNIDPMYYGMLKAKFPPALLADAIVQHKQRKKMENLGKQESEQKQKSSKKEAEPISKLLDALRLRRPEK